MLFLRQNFHPKVSRSSAVKAESKKSVLSPSTWGCGHPDRIIPCEARQTRLLSCRRQLSAAESVRMVLTTNNFPINLQNYKKKHNHSSLSQKSLKVFNN